MDELKMYGCDPAEFIAEMKNGITYKFSGASMVVAGLMSDAQECLSYGDAEVARQTLNLAKKVLFEIMDGNLIGVVKG